MFDYLKSVKNIEFGKINSENVVDIAFFFMDVLDYCNRPK